METEPDGSLCRITSSVKDCVNYIRILKVSEDELKSVEPAYKLVLMSEEKNNSESFSEKSDEEMFEVVLDIDLSTENFEKNKNEEHHDTKTCEVQVEKYKPPNENFVKKTFKKRYRSNNTRRNRNYNSFGTRNFSSSGNITKIYNRSVQNPSNNIQPWLNPPPQIQDYPYSMYHPYQPIIDPGLNISVNSNDKSVGLLGDSPYFFLQNSFQSNNQNNHFGLGQNYWSDDYCNNYQRSGQGTSISDKSVNCYYSNKRWKNKRQQSSWKRDQKGSQKGKKEITGHFEYRN